MVLREISKHLQLIRVFLLATILANFAPSAVAAERYALVFAQAAGEDQSTALTTQLADAIAQPDDLAACRKTSSCQIDRVQVSIDRSVSPTAALNKLQAGIAQLLVLPAPLAQDAAPGRVALQALGETLRLQLFVLVPAAHEGLALSSLRSKRVLFNSERSDLGLTIQALLARMELPEKTYKAMAVSDPGDQLRRLQRGQADAVVFLADTLPEAYVQALRAGQLKLLSPGKAEAQQAVLAYAGLEVAQVAAGVGPDYRTLSVPLLLLTTAALPLEQGQSILTRLQVAAQRGAVPAVRAQSTAVPLHRAAAALNSPAPAPAAEETPHAPSAPAR